MAHRWSAALGDQAKQAFRTALSGLREIPELAELQAGDDAGQFEGNFDYVAVLDFADFAAARIVRVAMAPVVAARCADWLAWAVAAITDTAPSRPASASPAAPR